MDVHEEKGIVLSYNNGGGMPLRQSYISMQQNNQKALAAARETI